MLSRECNGARPAGWKTRDGQLWFPTTEGVVAINPQTRATGPPRVVIEQVLLDGEAHPANQPLRIRPNQENLEIRYTGLSWTRPREIKFIYRMDKLDQNWIEAGARRTAYFSHLPAGEYTFRVIADNGEGVWNTEGQSLRIVVLPPFHQTWWFAALAALLAVGLVWLAFRYRETRLRQETAAQQAFSRRLIESQEQERRRIAAELHDSLGQHLLIIKNRATIGEQFAPAQSRTKEQFEEIDASAAMAIGEVRAIAYNLRPLNLERLGLTAVVEEMIENVSKAVGIKFAADIEPLDDLFSKEDEISFYRIIQEGVNNIVKHSQATKANIEVWRKDSDLHIAVRDNGRGFDPETLTADGTSRRFGLTSISERVRMLGGTHAITSTAQQGTTLSIKIPIHWPVGGRKHDV